MYRYDYIYVLIYLCVYLFLSVGGVHVLKVY